MNVKVKKIKNGPHEYNGCSVGSVEHRMKTPKLIFELHFIANSMGGTNTTVVNVCAEDLRKLADAALRGLGESL